MLTETTKALMQADASDMTLCEFLRDCIALTKQMRFAPALNEVNQRSLRGQLRLLVDMGLAAEGGKLDMSTILKLS